MVAVVGDLRAQFVVIAQPTGIHDVAGIETGLTWFFCAARKESVSFQRNIWLDQQLSPEANQRYLDNWYSLVINIIGGWPILVFKATYTILSPAVENRKAAKCKHCDGTFGVRDERLGEENVCLQ